MINKKKLVCLIGISVLIFSTVFPALINFSKDQVSALEVNLEPIDTKNAEKGTEKSLARLNFLENHIQGKPNEAVQIQVESDLPVREVRIQLPLDARIQEDLLQEGTVSPGETEGQWVVKQETETTVFDLPLSFDQVGEHTLVVVSEDDTTSEATVVVEEPAEEAIEEQEELEEQEATESTLEEEQESDGVSSDLEVNEEDVELTNGVSAEVTTFDELRLAVANPEVSQVEVRANLVRSGTGVATAIGSLNRDLTINGNGHSITFGADNGSLNLATLAEGEQATLRVVNASITKTGATSIFNAVGTGQGWSVELENITELAANAARLALIPEGKVAFTGGTNMFTRTVVNNVFLQAKDIEVSGGAQVTINRGNAYVLYSAPSIENPSLIITEGSSLVITTTGGTANAIDYRGPNPSIEVSETSNLSVQTVGTTAASTNTTNNGIILSGVNPELSIAGNSTVSVRTTLAKRGITLIANNPKISVVDSELTVTAATATGMDVNGVEASFDSLNSTITTTTTTGRGIFLTGEKSSVKLQDSNVNASGQTLVRIQVNGNEGTFKSINTKSTLVSTTGWGLYLSGGSNQAVLDEASEMEIRNTGTGQNIGIISDNSALIVKGKSSLTTTSAQGVTVNLLIQGTNPTLKIEDQSKLDVTTSGTTDAATVTTNIAVSLSGINPSVDVTGDSELSINVTANAKRGLQLNGATPSVNVEDSSVNLKGFTGLVMSLLGASPSVELDNANIFSESTNGRSIHFNGAGAILHAENSTMDLKGTGSNGIYTTGGTGTITLNNTALNAVSTTSGNISMNGTDNQLIVENQSTVDLTSTSNNNILLSGNNSNLTVEGASLLNTTTGAADSIRLVGEAPTLKVVGEGTEVEATSRYTTNGNQEATIFVGSDSFDTRIEDYLVEVGDYAKLVINANASSGLVMRGNNGRFEIYNQSELQISSGSYNTIDTGNSNASLRFMRSGTAGTAGNNIFNLDNAKLELKKGGGNAASVRMYGSNNQINVMNKGEFLISNPGSGTGLDGGTSGRNQGIHYTGGGTNNNGFSVRDPGSIVKINASSGAAIDMEGGTSSVQASNGGYFEASGRTSTAAAGIFNAGQLEVDFDNPLFMNFRNNRSGGGNIFNNTASSTLEAKNSDLAVWHNGSNLDGDPALNFPALNFAFTGLNFNTLGETDKPDILNTNTFGTSGLTTYSRLSSNNARWVIVDELRVPTNADKKIHGHVSIPVGLEDSRSAWEDEATVTVEIERVDGTKEEYTTKTEGHSNVEPGISIYGEEPRGGLFEIELEDFLQAGDKVRIKEAELTSGELSQGYENIILTETVEVFPIVPPTPAQFSSNTIPNNAETIVGRSTNKEVEVTATLNGTEMDTTDVTVADNGEFELSLAGLNLEEEDTIQVFLRDRKGSANESGVLNPPETNNARGNINPASPLYFHDTTFEPATTLTVTDVGPVSPVDPLNPEIEVDPENKPELPEDQGLISIDFVSQFDFGTKGISAQAQTYYANPQRLLNEDGTVNEAEERPNYVQVSDRRPSDTRGGWELALRQEGQFQTEDGKELVGAQLQLANAELVSAQLIPQPHFAQTTQVVVPGTRHRLIEANGDEGQGTWVYRFGDETTGGQSVLLDVPQGSNPDAASYSTTLNWELSAVPGN